MDEDEPTDEPDLSPWIPATAKEMPDCPEM
jgi:hypothetical protein